jgi:cold shock protein
MIGSMSPHHRAQLAAAVAQFLADIRRLGRAKLRNERDRFLGTLEPSRARPAATKEVQRPARERAKSPRRGVGAPTTGRSPASATATRRARNAGAVKPSPPPGQRRSRATRPARGPATDAPRQASAPVHEPQANATPVNAAPVIATPATEVSGVPDVAGAVPATDVRRQGEPAARERDHEGRQHSARRRGTVKWFNPSKGYGFIRDDDGMDIFVHASAVADAGFRTLVQGQAVEYEVQRSAKGLHAVSISAPGAVTLRSA